MRSTRTANAIERLHEEFKRRIKTQTVLPSAETAAMLFWALLAEARKGEPGTALSWLKPRSSERTAKGPWSDSRH
jgi:transposase-like protein